LKKLISSKEENFVFVCFFFFFILSPTILFQQVLCSFPRASENDDHASKDPWREAPTKNVIFLDPHWSFLQNQRQQNGYNCYPKQDLGYWFDQGILQSEI
jgi:hypothetical protein